MKGVIFTRATVGRTLGASRGLMGAPYSEESAMPVVFAVCVSRGFRSTS